MDLTTFFGKWCDFFEVIWNAAGRIVYDRTGP